MEQTSITGKGEYMAAWDDDIEALERQLADMKEKCLQLEKEFKEQGLRLEKALWDCQVFAAERDKYKEIAEDRNKLLKIRLGDIS